MASEDDDSGVQISRDREKIQRWADQHNAVPVRRTTAEDESGRYQMVPEDKIDDTLERVEWNAFFDNIEAGNQVVIYQDEAATNPLDAKNAAEVFPRLEDEDIEERLIDGETVASTVTETAVVETVVVEELTFESELVSEEVLDTTVIDQEVQDFDIVSSQLLDRDQGDAEQWFDATTFLDTVTPDTDPEHPPESGDNTASTTGQDRSSPDVSVDSAAMPYAVELEVIETWDVVWEVTKQYTIESEITNANASEQEALEEYDLDVAGLHRSLVESGIIQQDLATDELLANLDVDSHIDDEHQIITSFTRDQRIEETVENTKKLHGDMTDAVSIDVETSPHTGDQTGDAASPSRDRVTTLSEDLVGHVVEDASKTMIGIVADVDSAEDRVYVTVEPDLTDRIRAALGWSDTGESTYRLSADSIADVTDEKVQLKERGTLESRREHL